MNTFKELELSAPLMSAIEGMGFETPSPIQALTLPILLKEETDFLGLAATGTGKTAAYGIPLLERLPEGARGVQAIILCPTRELALQVSEQINLLGKFKNIKSVAIYGGASYGDQLHGLKQGAAIVVGTPGRVIDHIERGSLKLDKVKTVILDEADEMISMGFKDELDQILSAVPRDESNIWLFSATLNPGVRRVADTYLRNPKQVQINRTEVLSSTVEQYYYVTREQNKPEVICKLIDAAPDFYGIIFCQTKILVTDLSQYLSERGYKVDSLHGDKGQRERESTMRAFRERRVQMLICTDVAARGLDVKDVTHVINYSLPRELDNYVHRIGRTARSGKAGLALNLVTPSHRYLIGKIEQITKSRMKEGVLPTRRTLATLKMAPLLEQFKTQQTFSRAVEVMSPEWKEALKEMSPEEIAGRFISLRLPEIFAEDMNRNQSEARDDEGSRDNYRNDRRGDSRGGDRSYRGDRGDRGGSRPYRDNGPARSFNRDDRPAPRRFEGEARPARQFDGDARPPRQFDRAERPAPKFSRDDRPARKFEGDDRVAPKFDKTAAPAKKFEGNDRPARKFEGTDRPAKKFNRDDKPARKFEGGDRPARVTEGDTKGGSNFPKRAKPHRKGKRPESKKPAVH